MEAKGALEDIEAGSLKTEIVLRWDYMLIEHLPLLGTGICPPGLIDWLGRVLLQGSAEGQCLMGEGGSQAGQLEVGARGGMGSQGHRVWGEAGGLATGYPSQ